MSSNPVFTRAEYMRTYGDEQTRAHRRYYAQGVTPWVTSLVLSRITENRLRESRDPHLNDITLVTWDRMEPALRDSVIAFNKKVGNGACYSLCDAVCIAKEAARQWIERDAASRVGQ